MFVQYFLWPLRFSWLLICGLYKEDYFQIFKRVSFGLHNFCGYWEGWEPVNQFNHTSWVAIVTATDRPKSVRNRCVIEVFGGVLCVVTLLLGLFYRCRGLCHRTESYLFLFLSECILIKLSKTTVTLPKPTVARQAVSKQSDNRATSAEFRPSSAPILADLLVGRRLFCRSTKVKSFVELSTDFQGFCHW